MVRRGLDMVAALLLCAVLAVTFAQVVARYLLDISMPWSEELTRLLFVWLILIGAARARHMHIDILPSVLSPSGERVLQICISAVGALLLGFLAYQALTLIDITAYDRFTALGVSVQYLYLAVVVGSVVWSALAIAEAVLGPPSDEPPPSA